MIDWIKIALLLLQLVNKALDWGRQQRAFTEGEDHEIARQGAEMLKRTNASKKILEEISSLPEPTVDDLLRSLEPASGSQQRLLL